MTTSIGVRIFQKTIAIKDCHGVSKETLVTLDVDVDWLIRQLGERAFFNKSRKTKAMNGGLIAKVNKGVGDG